MLISFVIQNQIGDHKLAWILWRRMSALYANIITRGIASMGGKGMVAIIPIPNHATNWWNMGTKVRVDATKAKNVRYFTQLCAVHQSIKDNVLMINALVVYTVTTTIWLFLSITLYGWSGYALLWDDALRKINSPSVTFSLSSILLHWTWNKERESERSGLKVYNGLQMVWFLDSLKNTFKK